MHGSLFLGVGTCGAHVKKREPQPLSSVGLCLTSSITLINCILTSLGHWGFRAQLGRKKRPGRGEGAAG